MKMYTRLVILALGLAFAMPKAFAKNEISVVDFGTCIQDSKYGKREQESFESLKRQLHSILDDAEKQLNDVIAKLQDQDYLDTLSPAGENELKQKFQALNEELNRYQGQYYQIMQQANMRLIQSLAIQINKASEYVAREKKIAMVLNKEAAFYYEPSLDITNVVINQMDKDYEIAKQEGKLPETQTMMANPKELMQQGGYPAHG